MDESSSTPPSDHERLVQAFTAVRAACNGRQEEILQHLGEEDPSLRVRVEALLRHAEAHPRFLRTPIADAKALFEAMDGADLPRGEADGGDAHAQARIERIGRYRIVRLLGAGAFAQVFEAVRDVPPGFRVALKVLRSGLLDREARWRLETECAALIQASHPNVVQLLDAGVDEAGRPYLAMELVRGVPLATHDAEDPGHPLHGVDLRGVAAVHADVCDAVAFLHERGIIHRDLKPSNILVTVVDRRPLPKVIDLGVARALEGRLVEGSLATQPGGVIGTPSYLSPEALAGRGDLVDARSDIYALGVVLWELIANIGRPSGERRRLDSADVAGALRRANRCCPADLAAVVEKATAPRREDRYPTAAALAADLRRWLAHEPVSATRSSGARRALLFVRRRPALATALACVAAVVATVIVTSLAQAARLRRDLDATVRSVDRLVGDVVLALQDTPGTSVAARAALETALGAVDHAIEAAGPQQSLLSRRAQALLLLGEVDEAQGDYAAAEERFAEASAIWSGIHETSPDDLLAARAHSVALVKLGDLRKAAGDLAAAGDWYTRAWQVDERLAAAHPGDAGAWGTLAWSHIRLGDLALARQAGDDAGRCLAQAADALDRLERVSSDRNVVDRGRCEVALLRAVVAALRADPAEQERELRAAHALALRVHERGLTRRGAALLANASSALAQFLGGNGRPAEARSALGPALTAAARLAEEDADSAEAYSLRAKLHWTAGNVAVEEGALEAGLAEIERALPLVAQARRLSPERSNLVDAESGYEMRRAEVLGRLGRAQEARSACGRGLALAREGAHRWPAPQRLYWLGTQLLAAPEASMRRPEEALDLARRAQALAPHLAVAVELEADALAALGRPSAAIAAFRRAAGLFEGQSPSYVDRCRRRIQELSADSAP